MVARDFVLWLVRATDSVLDSLGVGELSLEMHPEERRRIFIASVLPAVVVIAALYQLGLEIERGLSSPDLDAWSRLAVVSDSILQLAPFLAAAVLMIHGVGTISRGMGTWCFVVAAMTVGVAALLTIYIGIVELLVNPADLTYYDLHPRLARVSAEALAIIAVGYGYLAYRGLIAKPTDAAALE